ncbi:hypothetical protein GGI02_002890, partial [Coemansia sp. RSA 2322]
PATSYPNQSNMRFFIALAVFSCLLALCSATYLGMYNAVYHENYETNDNDCHHVSSKFNTSPNQASANGGAITLFTDSKCKNAYAYIYSSNSVWTTIYSPIKSYRAGVINPSQQPPWRPSQTYGSRR